MTTSRGLACLLLSIGLTAGVGASPCVAQSRPDGAGAARERGVEDGVRRPGRGDQGGRREAGAELADDPIAKAAKAAELRAQVADIDMHLTRLGERRAKLVAAADAIDTDQPIERIRELLREVPMVIRASPFVPSLERFSRERRPEAASPMAEPIDLELLEEFMGVLEELNPDIHEWMTTTRDEEPERFARIASERQEEWRELLEEYHRNPELFKLEMDARKLKWRTRRAARNYVDADGGEAKKAAYRELRAVVSEQFQVSLDISQIHFTQAAKVVQRLAEEIEDRKARASELIEERMAEVIGEAQNAPREPGPRGVTQHERGRRGPGQDDGARPDGRKPSPRRVNR